MFEYRTEGKALPHVACWRGWNKSPTCRTRGR